MSTRIFTLGKQGEGRDLGEAATKVFGGLEVAIELPDAGATAEETVQRLLDRCGGDHQNLRNIFVGQSAALTIQKAIKDRAKALAPRVLLERGETPTGTEEEVKKITEAGPISYEAAVAELTAIATGPLPKHVIRGEGESTGKKSAGVKKAVDAEKAKAVESTKAMLAVLPAKVRDQAIEALRTTNPELHAALTAQTAE